MLYRAHEPDIDRAAERISRAASAAVAGAADAGVRARHRARRRRRRWPPSCWNNCARSCAAPTRSTRRAAPTTRRGCCSVRWSRFCPKATSGAARSDPPRIAAAGLAMAEPRRRARAGARFRGGADDADSAINRRASRSRGSRVPSAPRRTLIAVGLLADGDRRVHWPASARPTCSRICCRSALCCGPRGAG